MIGKVKKTLSIPVIANGDITNQEDLKKCLDITGADGVMIGRGALGNPWILAQDKNIIKQKNNMVDVILRHAKLHIEHYGEGSLVTFRKHLLHYFKGMPGIKGLKQELVKVTTFDSLVETLKEI